MRVGIIGLGLMGEYYVRIVTDLVGPENVLGVEADRDRAEMMAAAHGITVTQTWQEIVGTTDAAIIALPDHLHTEPAVAFLQAGSYVLVEKPLATSLADCQTILEAQTEPGRLMVGHVLRFDHRIQELKRRLDAQEFGNLRYLRIHRSNSTMGAKRVGERVSVSAFLGVHDLDLLLWLTQREIRSVSATGKKIFGSHWDLSIASLELEDGTLALVENHWLLHPDAQRSALAGIEVFGDTGMALLDLSTQELEIVTDDNPRTKRIDTHNWTFDAAVSGGNLRREVEAFIAAARTGGPTPISGEDGMRAVEAVQLVEDALARSTN
ncbi:UDP-N-acetylglucosamine 3-dehydrogenase [Tessaracoccus lubricantis]|uniref:UDP-N-acetylglucosamine 3-dehydrogenase n=1 Tax=Tessaracoccus lubricantis TaxID=545543 RepID=A0ABP9FBX2_9ACTN